MADYFTGYNNPVPAGAQNSMADMLNLASGIQNYKQAQQVNPLKLQATQLELQQAQQMNPLALRKAEAETNVAEQTQDPLIAAEKAKAKQADIKTLSDQYGLDSKQHQDFAKILSGYQFDSRLKDPSNVKTSDALDIMHEIKSSALTSGIAPKTADVLTANGLVTALKDPSNFSRYINNTANATMTSADQRAAYAPKARLTDIGGKLINTVETPSIAGSVPSIGVAGNVSPKTLSPQVFANPITGQPQVLGGAGGAGAGGGGMPQGQPSANIQPQASGQLTQGANESPKVFSDRVAQTQNAYAGALDQYNNPRSSLGHIPTIQNINNNIMELLKDPSVNTGAIADYLANKTNKGALNPKEQELTKYLQQRIQNLTPRTDNDAQSKQQAYGSFNLDKDALKEVIRNDNQWVTSQDLYAKGILHNGSNPTNPQNPNYGNVSTFTSQFAPFAADPTLMRYVSLVGEKSKVKLDKEDVGTLNKLLGNMSQQDKMALEQKRQQLLKLVNPGGQ
jgi:hypothetical protein